MKALAFKGKDHRPIKAASSSQTSELHTVCNEAIIAAKKKLAAADTKKEFLSSGMTKEEADDEDGIEAVRLEIEEILKAYAPMWEKAEEAKLYLEIKASDCLGTRSNCMTRGRFRPLEQPTLTITVTVTITTRTVALTPTLTPTQNETVYGQCKPTLDLECSRTTGNRSSISHHTNFKIRQQRSLSQAFYCRPRTIKLRQQHSCITNPYPIYLSAWAEYSS